MGNELDRFLKHYHAKEVIIKEGADEDDFFCLVDGTISIWKGDPEDKTKMIRIGEINAKGSYFGEMGWLLKEKRTASIIADTQAQVLKFPGDMLPIMIQKNAKLALKLCTALADRLKGTTKKNEEVATERNELREDAAQDLLYAKAMFQKMFILLTALQLQFQNPLLKSIIENLSQDRLLKGGKKPRLDESFFQGLPDKMAELVHKAFPSS